MDVFAQGVSLKRARWTVTGAAGFIGSNLVEGLLALNQNVVGVDNFSTGRRENLDKALARCRPEQRKRFTFIEGDIQSPQVCREACKGASVILHHAAVVSVPFSVEHPTLTFDVNSKGFINILDVARAEGSRVVYASSSAVYGDLPGLPKTEESPVAPISPYGLSKRENELWGALYWRSYGVPTVGLRYFNIFGARQDPKGAYAAVVAAWMSSLKKGRPGTVYGDGSNTRGFCHVRNVVEANILAGTTERKDAFGEVFNISSGSPVTLLELYDAIRSVTGQHDEDTNPLFAPRRSGDILHSSSDISKAERVLGFVPTVSLEEGLADLAREDG